MNSYINYLLEANLCLLIFGLFYYLVLRNDTNFRFSRYYLVGSALLTLTIPLLHFENPFTGDNALPLINDLQAITLPELVISDGETAATMTSEVSWSWITIAGFAYLSIVIVMLTLFLYQLYQVYQFRALKKDVTIKHEGHTLIPTDGQLPTFAFFNMLFFDNTAALSEQEKKKVLEHEVVHIRQKHSLDIIVLELVKILFWINPVAWWMRKSVQNIHEYLADQSILKNTDEDQYSSLLAKMTLRQMSLSVGHHFNKSMTLKRIKMMKTPKTKFKTWKWASLVPMMALIVTVLSCNDEVMKDVNEVMATTTQMQIPASLDPVLKDLQAKYPEADFIYMETAGTNLEEVARLQDLDQKSIAYFKVWKEKETIGMIINKNGPVQAVEKDDETFAIVEQPAEPVGGYGAMYARLAEELVYPAQARKAGVEGKVYVQFIVDTDGSLTDITAVKGIGAGCDSAAIAAMSKMGPFTPPMQRGKAVRQRIILPITFKLEDETSAKIKVHEKEDSPESEMHVKTKRDGLTVSGTLTNAAGDPISGANIVIKGTFIGTVSDHDGIFTITASTEDDNFVISHISYSTKTIALEKC